MAIRLLPFRDYDEHDVINLYSLKAGEVNDTLNESGTGDAGVFVQVDEGDLDKSPVEYGADTGNYMMGAHTIPHLGFNKYPSVPLTVKATTAAGDSTGSPVIGMTLRQTAKLDENGENLLRYPVKLDEYQAVSPGQAVPIATKGIFMLDAGVISDKKLGGPAGSYHANDNPFAGATAFLGAEAGKLGFSKDGFAKADEGGADYTTPVGTVLAVGTRSAGGPSNIDVHAIDHVSLGKLIILLKLEL